jgi:predicted nucleotide-binding protein (sugar kinase/HSP70/actin superfamily)
MNEACSSGCGSFLQTFANALGYGTEEFAKLGFYGQRPVDLGSRCTVFMNSLVKQAQKDGASIENISAGLSISVIKNALYKVIRPTAAEPLGKRIVAQGGTFLNDGVLRAFEQELDAQVVRPNIAGLMGAYGAALYAQEQTDRKAAAIEAVAPKAASAKAPSDRRARDRRRQSEPRGRGAVKTGLLDKMDLQAFKHSVASANCGMCSNNCQLTINDFGEGRRFISGNRCSQPITNKKNSQDLNLYEYKRQLLEEYRRKGAAEGAPGNRTIGIPMGLNMYELLPFWQAFFNALGYRVLASPPSSREMYLTGQGNVTSDTVCYPAKLVHGHIRYLLDQGVDAIFYPCMTYNLDEGLGDNHYNCPVVAYYPEVIAANDTDIKKTTFIYDYVGLHRPRELPQKICKILEDRLQEKLKLGQVNAACEKGFGELAIYRRKVEERGSEIISRARHEGRHIIVLTGRPYHIDSEINHGIDQLITGFGAAVITEDALSLWVERAPGTVLNQWTYHSRLYAAAHYAGTQPDMDLVQLVSFGCGVDAITTDEVRDILEEKNKIYTQLKIDEIANLGAVRIRLRSLLAAIGGERTDE